MERIQSCKNSVIINGYWNLRYTLIYIILINVIVAMVCLYQIYTSSGALSVEIVVVYVLSALVLNYISLSIFNEKTVIRLHADEVSLEKYICFSTKHCIRKHRKKIKLGKGGYLKIEQEMHHSPEFSDCNTSIYVTSCNDKIFLFRKLTYDECIQIVSEANNILSEIRMHPETMKAKMCNGIS